MRFAVAVVAAAALAHAAPAAAQSPTQADEEAAKAHFLAGSAYYEQADYADAVREFTEAHRLSKRPDLLYNISVSYERLGRWDDAIAALRQYLVERPGAPDRAVIESRIANFSQRRDQERALEEAAAAPPPPPINASPPVVPPSRPRHVVSLIVGGIGAGLLAAAVGTGVTAHVAYEDLGEKCLNMVCDGNDTTLRHEQSFGRALAISTDVLIGLGAAGLAAGIILFVVETRRAVPLHARAGSLLVTF